MLHDSGRNPSAGRYTGRCPNVQDGCEATVYCAGCDDVLCQLCWNEHVEDGPDHEEVSC